MKQAATLAVGLVLGLSLLSIAQADPRKDRVIGQGQIAFRGHGPEWWYNRAAVRYSQVRTLQGKLGVARRALNRARRVTLTSPDALTAIRIASLVYHVDYTMLHRRASCETGGTFDPNARNNSSSDSPMGLFQIKPSTFASTPFAGLDIFNGYINALAAGWMMGPAGRAGEWSCK